MALPDRSSGWCRRVWVIAGWELFLRTGSGTRQSGRTRLRHQLGVRAINIALAMVRAMVGSRIRDNYFRNLPPSRIISVSTGMSRNAGSVGLNILMNANKSAAC